MAPPLSRQSSLENQSPSSRDRILVDRAGRLQTQAQPAFMQLGANLASLQAGQAAYRAEQPAVPLQPTPQTHGYPAMAPTSTMGGNPVLVPAPPAQPASLWQQSAGPAQGGGDPAASLESDFERTIRLIEEANQKRGS